MHVNWFVTQRIIRNLNGGKSPNGIRASADSE